MGARAKKTNSTPSSILEDIYLLPDGSSNISIPGIKVMQTQTIMSEDIAGV